MTLSPASRTILDLCGNEGDWSAPYRNAGYHVIVVDLKRGRDVRLLELDQIGPIDSLWGVLCAPPLHGLRGLWRPLEAL